MVDCITTGIIVFTVTVLVSAMVYHDAKYKLRLLHEAKCNMLYDKVNKWKTRCRILCEQLEEIKDAVVDKPEIKTKWSHYTEGE